MRSRRLAGPILFALASAAAAQGPSADWRTVETEHFRVHFPAPFQAWALHAASEIEAIHARVTDYVGYVPARRIEVVVADPAADANGMAIPFLDRPEIVLWTSPPESESGGGDYGDWMELLATHEVAHIVHLTRPRNRSLPILARLSPAPFGPLALKSPRWLTEGYATLVEGALTGSGRPNSTFRTMVLRQFAIEGKFPSYAALDSTSGWLGGSMAYLVGSAYLEWLSEREGKDSLPRLWKRMASSRGGSFDSCFRAVFGQSPRDLYDRFRAERTAAAIEEEKRLEAAGIAAGELWQRLDGGTIALEASPDGSRLLARRDPKRGESFLAVWQIAETEEERRAAEARRREEEKLARDPNEVPDRGQTPESRRPPWTLPRENGFAASDPRWMPGGESVLFTRRGPDAEGVLRVDLYRWRVERGEVERVTRGADVGDADPAPDSRWAAGVRNRFGATALVRVDLPAGQTRELPVSLPQTEAWPVWSHPRVSPDGTRIAALLHARRRWRLVTLPAEGGEAREIPVSGAPASAPAWSPDGARIFVASSARGVWDLVSVDASGAGEEALTRVTGGAFGPAPTPDGKALFFLELTARGVDVRRLSLEGHTPISPERAITLPPTGEVPPPQTSPTAASRPYDVWETQAIRPLVNFSVGPSGDTVQLGLDASDVLDRLHWLAMGSLGNAAGPRGGSVAAAYRGLPVAITAQLFSAIEKPGNQSLGPRPAFDEERWGGFLDLAWWRPFSWGRVGAWAGGGGTRVEAFTEESTFTRALGSIGAEAAWRRTRGRWGVGIEGDVSGSLGSTGGVSWNQWAGGARLSGIAPFASLSASARYGETGGSPSLFDLFSIGGAPSAILPPGLDRNRIQSPALPADLQAGERFEAYRAELSGSSVPLAVYAEWMRAWNGGSARPDPVRVAGLEARLERLIPAEFGRTVTFHVGVGWIVSDTPRIDAARGYAQLIYRP